jgi:hypothetical protein
VSYPDLAQLALCDGGTSSGQTSGIDDGDRDSDDGECPVDRADQDGVDANAAMVTVYCITLRSSKGQRHLGGGGGSATRLHT